MVGTVRTTIRLDDQLLREAKRTAAEGGGTLTELIEEALREKLGRAAAPPRHWIGLPTHPGGFAPGVDIDSSAGLLPPLSCRSGCPPSAVYCRKRTGLEGGVVDPVFAGKVVLVTGASSGIGRCC